MLFRLGQAVLMTFTKLLAYKHRPVVLSRQQRAQTWLAFCAGVHGCISKPWRVMIAGPAARTCSGFQAFSTPTARTYSSFFCLEQILRTAVRLTHTALQTRSRVATKSKHSENTPSHRHSLLFCMLGRWADRHQLQHSRWRGQGLEGCRVRRRGVCSTAPREVNTSQLAPGHLS